MKAVKTIYLLDEAEVREHPLILSKDSDKVMFYTWLREILSPEDDCDFSVTGIRIAQNIQDIWVEIGQEQGIDTVTINMMLLQYGPRVDETLSENEVCILDNFLVK